MAPGSALVGWLPWVAGAVAVGVAGAALGVGGVFGRATEQVTVVSSTGVLPQSALALSCPGGAVVDELSAGTRVLAIARSEDSGYLGVRDPDNYGLTLWVAAGSVTIDAGQTDAAALPTGACPEVTITLEPDAEPSAPAPAPSEPAPNQPAPPPSDTTAPTIQQAWATPTTIYCPSNVGPGFPGNTVIHLLVSDNVGVVSASISWSGGHSGSGSMSPAGGEWQFPFTMPVQSSGDLTFTLTARDAAGNAQSTTVGVGVECLE